MSDQYILPKVDCRFFDEDTNPRFCMVLKEAYCFKERCRFYKTREEVNDGSPDRQSGQRSGAA